MLTVAGLNRTSVGLKLILAVEEELTPSCLNRTSVGLKLRTTGIACPNSRTASIEPAWD